MSRGRPRKGSIPLEQEEDVVAFYAVLKKSLPEIAEKYGVTTYVVKQLLNKYGVPARPRGRIKRVPVPSITAPL